MLDKRAIANIILLLFYVVGFYFYLYFLFYVNSVIAKAIYYSITAITLIYLTIEDYNGYSTDLNKQYNIITKFVIIFNFIIIALTLKGYLINDRVIFAAFNGCIFVATIIITYLGFKHEIFKD